MTKHTDAELKRTLTRLIAAWESEVVEFKNVGDSYSTSDIGKYLTALANEANLRDVDTAWLVFGVDNKTREIVDSDYRRDRARLDGLKQQMTEDSSPSICFREIHEIDVGGDRVLMFEIPAAPRGIAISWNGHYYARSGESLGPLSIAKQDEIRGQTLESDWTAGIVADAERRHLSDDAIEKARENFAIKHARSVDVDEVTSWDDRTFLDRASLTIDGQITRAALLLVGEPTSTHLLSPYLAQLVWKLVGPEQGNEIFTPPYLLATSALYERIRNVQIRILPADSLIAVEVAKYDQKIVLESIHNCIAHQDYRLGARIVVTEMLDRIVLENSGDFFEGHPDDYVFGTKTPRSYRNPFLMQAMTRLNMIDTLGYGIHRMYVGQARRYFPLPDYDVSEHGTVRLTIPGALVDEAYSRILIQKTDLPLEDVFALDRVQKGLPIESQALKRLRRAKLVEGRKNQLHVSEQVASITGDKARYIRTRAQDDAHYKQLILDFIGRFGSASREDVDELLLKNLSEALGEEQKRTKVSNLLTAMRRAGTIHNAGSRTQPRWKLGEEQS
ncbi:Divergent AAA domain protein [Rubripirellula lacrimiformis]|uniref:Divergent AAA domain protein n=1 Tax=Rubripirellula lacrimiformis TaxID=1930273 RepID=A0A517NAS0_9BACT|nr:RNA-binding domain-containing protein [Rubripirellula lacrimiformis]QDT04222.1 Divergent AAA domain protein [Rubripirellula lacrimiformis]